jgi:hypothetical protein
VYFLSFVVLRYWSVFRRLYSVIRHIIQTYNVWEEYILSESCTGLFISPSGISEIDCAITKTDTAERTISIGRETLQVFFCTRGLGVLAGSTARG